jgi:ribosome-associated protein
MKAETLAKKVVKGLDEMKAIDIRSIDVKKLTSITDIMVIASGRSDRQVRALAQKAVEIAKKADAAVLGTEGEREGQWILVDLGDVIVHLMHPTARAYYQLEKLWMDSAQQLKSLR